MSLMDVPDYGALQEPGASPVALPDLGISVPGHHIIGDDYQRWLVEYNETGPEHSSLPWPSEFPFPFPFPSNTFSDQDALHDSELFGDSPVNGDLQSKLVHEQQVLRSLDGLPNPDLALVSSVSDPANEQAQSSATTTPLPAKKATVRRRYGPEKWEAIRDTLHEIYILQGNTLSQTMRILEEKHGFIASDKQFKDKIRVWGFQKNKKRNPMETAP